MADDAAALAKQKAAAYVGQVVGGRYRVESIVALGGMGAVFRAEHVHMRKQVALKLLHPMTENLPELVARFERESIVGAHVSHPCVCQATDFGVIEDGSHYLVLEYVEGRTLHELLKEGRIEPARAAEIARQIAAGLGAAHRLGIFHRDVKPSNLMLCDGDRTQVKIVDFGLAKLDKDRFHVKEDITVTTSGQVFGTVAYMAPELARGMHKVDHRSDLYALGVVLYEMLAGKRPYDAADPVALFKLIRTAPPPPFAERAPDADVPPELEAIVQKLLEKEPEARYQSAEELIEALDEACPGEEAPAPSAVPPARSSSRGARSARGALEIVEPSDASPPPAPPLSEASASVHAPPGKGGLRPWLFAVMVVLLGLLAVKGFAPEVWAKLGGTGAAAKAPGREATDRPTATRVGPVAPSVKTTATAITTTSTTTTTATVSAADLYPMRFALGEAAAAHDGKRGARALLALAKAGPEAFKDRDVIANAAQVAVTVALMEPAHADEVFVALSGPGLGESGPDVLFQITSYYGGSRGAVRATDLLAKPEILARASPALRIARDLKSAPCQDRPALYDRAAAEGDERALVLFEAMLAPSCAAATGACCAPHDAKLAAAHAALRKRLKK